MYFFQLLAASKLRLIFLVASIVLISCEKDSSEEEDLTKKDPVIENPDTGQQVPVKPTDNPNPPNPNPPTPPTPPTKPDTPKPDSNTPPTGTDKGATEVAEMLALVNQFRKEEGLNPVVLNDALNTAALKHSKDMDVQDYFDHTGKDGSSFTLRVERENYNGFAFGENIAISGGTKQTFELWKNSSGHKENMLNPSVNEMGVGRAGKYWTQIFGRKGR